MNYAGKLDAKLSIDGSGLHSRGHAHVETITHHATHAPSDAIIVPDPQLLFNGEFKRSGVDLILSRDGHELLLHDYFKGEKRAPLASPDGAHLTGDLVDALTGHTQVAQADGSAGVGKVIGHVTKLTGTATAVRNGVSIILHQGDNVEKGDVVQSGSDSTLGITFIDGTVFGLLSNARMVLNEMVYDPNGSNNSSLLSLVAGTITFVAGETAKHGDMKVDTPVATMGIRGTAVLVEIDFIIPGGQPGLYIPPGQLPDDLSQLLPELHLQVLVEPDGTTGSFFAFEKGTLTKIAEINQAGQQINISQGVVTVTNATLPPDIQKLITDVFSLRFTDNSNPKTFDHQFTDTVVPQSLLPIQLADGTTAIPVVLLVKTASAASPSGPGGPTDTLSHIPGPPQAVAFGNSLTELVGKTGDVADVDTVSGKVNYVDINAGDVPTVKTAFTSFTYQDAQHNDVTATLNAQQLADIKAIEVKLIVVQDPAGKNTGSATWTYNIPDNASDFLAVGEKVILTYTAEVDNNFAPNNEAAFVPFTITITGTNDVPVITTGPQNISFAGGKTTPGGPLTTTDPTSGTLSFADVDLTDTHTVSTKLTSALLNGADIASLAPAPLKIFETALSASIATGNDSTGTGAGTVDWQLADLPAYLADFVPAGQTLTLTYTVTVTDSQATTSTQIVTVAITGTDTPAVVWIATTTSGSTGDWNDPSNWETGTVPTAVDDAIIITDQLQNLTPYYPVTIDAPAFANSLIMNDFGADAPELDNNSDLTIGGGLGLSADAIVKNFGNISLGGLAEILNQSSLQNSGFIALGQGGDFKDQSSVTNSGTIEVAGGTLNIQVDVANAGGHLNVDGTAKVTLNGAAIDSGTVTNNGEIDLTGAAVLKNGSLGNSGQINVSGTGNALQNENVAANHAIEVLVGGALLLDQGTTVANASGTVTVDGTATLTLNDATITGGTVTDSGTIHVTGDSAIDSASVNGGQLTVDATRTLTLDDTTVTGTTVTDNGTIKVDAGKTLNLSGVALTGGAIDNLGTVDITGDSSINNDALSNTQLTVDATATLTLNGTTITGGTVTDSGTIHVTGGSAIDSASVNGGQLTVDATRTLTLDDTTVTGTTVTDNGTIKVDAGKTLNLSGVALTGGAIDNLGIVAITGDSSINNDALSNTQLTVDATATLTLNGTTITGGTVTDSGTIHVTGDSAIDSASVNGGQLMVDAARTLTLDDTTVTGTTITGADISSIVHTDNGQTLTLNGATVSGGSLANDGTIDSTGISAITDVGITNTGLIEATNGVLTIDPAGGVTISNSGTLEANGGELDIINEPVTNTGTLQAINDSTLKLTSTVVTNAGGAVTVASGSTLDLIGATINGGTLGNGGIMDVSGTGNALEFVTVTNNGTIEILAASALKITGSISGGGSVVIDAGATLELGATDTQTVSFSGDSGELQLDASSFGGQIQGLAATDKLDLQNIAYGANTTATYVGGVLIVTDGIGDSVSLTLVGDYSAAHFAGSDDGLGHTLITLTAADDAPVVADKTAAASVAELAATTGLSTLDLSSPVGGTIHFTDVDLTDRPTATVTAQAFTWLAADGHTDLTSSLTPTEMAQLGAALALIQAGNTNNGAIGWTYSITDSVLDFIGAGETVTVVSTLTLNDHQGGTDTATVTVTINGADDAPLVLDDSNSITAGDAPVSGNLLANDSDVEHQTLSVSNINGENPAAWVADGIYGELVVDSVTGNYTYTLGVTSAQAAAVSSLGQGFIQQDQFTYTASDGMLGTDAHLTIDVTGTNGSLVAHNDTIASGFLEDTATTLTTAQLLGNDFDVVGTPNVTSVGDLNGHSLHGGTVSLNGNLITYAPAADYNGPDSFTYTISDGGFTSTAVVSFNVAAVDDAPVATAVALAAGTEDTAYTINAATLLAGVTDLDGPSLSITSVSVASGGGSVVNNGDGTFTYTPAANYNGPVSFNYTASDGTLSSSSTASLTLAAVDDAPVATAVALAAGTEDTAYTINAATLLAGVTDLDGPSLSITSVSVASGGGSVVNNGDGTFTYTPAANYNGPVSFNYTASDGTLSSSSTASLTLAAVDDAPVATAVTLAAGTEDTAYTINAATLLAGVTDLDGPSLSITSVSVASGGGSVVNNGDGTFTYTPAANYNGPVSFNYTASDGTLSSSSTASLTLAAVDDAPVATAVTLAAGTEDTAYTINAATLLAGVTDLDGPSLSITSVSVASGGGSVVNNGDGTFTYTPAANYNGPVSFNYTASDGTLSSSSTASLTLAAVDDAPVATAVALAAGTEDTAYTINAATLLAGVTDLDGPSLSITSVSVASGGGSVVNNGDGTFTYTPAANYNGPVSFNYTASDGTLSSSSTASLTLAAVDDAPVATAVALAAGTEDTAYTINAATLLAGVTDLDGPSLSITSVSVASGGGSVVNNGDGTFTYTPAANYNGPVSFNYTASDGTLSSSSTASLTLAAVDDAPVATAVTLAAGTEDTAYTINAATLLAGVTDLDGPSLSITSVSVASGGGSVVNNGDGTFTYTPAANYNGPVSFNYTASDGTLSSSSTASLTLAAVDDAPVATAVTLAAGTEDTAYTINAATLLAGVTDLDGPSLSITSVSVASGGGSVVNNGDGTFTYTPAANYNGPVSFNYTASDGTLSSSSTASLTLAAVDDAPVATAVTLAAGTEDTAYTINAATLLAGVTDLDGPSLSITSVSVASGGGSVVNNGDGTFTYTPAANYNGPVSFNYTASDGTLSSSSTASLTLAAVDDAPVATAVTLAAGTEDTAYTINAATLLAGVTDLDGPSLSITSVSVASGGGSVVNNGDGTFTYTPAANYNGPVSFNYTASDGTLSSSSTASLTLAAVDDAPVATAVTLAAGTEDTAYTINAATLLAGVTDLDGPSLSITSVSVASGGGSVVNNGDGTFTYTPAANYNGPVSFNYTASDGTLSSSSTASLTLAAVDDAPVATAVTLAAGTEDTAYTINAATLLAGVTDLDGPSLSITSVSVASGGGSVVNNGDGTFTYTPAANYNGPVSFNYTASDGTLSSSSTASLTLAAVDDAPVATAVTLAAGTEDTAYTINAATLLAGVTDLDGPSLSITSVSVASGGGSVVNNGDGTFTYTPAANYNGPVSFNYTASDGTLSSSSTASLTLAAVNDAPVITAASLTVAEGGTVLVTPANIGVTDPDSSSFTFTVTNVSHGTFQTTTDGVTWVDATTFTSIDLAANHVRFVQDGSATAPTFSIQADDGAAANHLGNVLAGTITFVPVAGAILGDAGDNTLIGTPGNDVFQGFGGNDTIIGLTGVDRAIYTDAAGGITVNLGAGTASGAGVGTDTLVAIEGVVGSDFADTFNAAGFAGAAGTPGTPVGFNEFEGRGGNDTVISAVNEFGAALTRVSYVSATAGVTVDIAAGTADGDGSVGHDTFVGSGILSIWGSSFADTLYGSNNGFGTIEVFAGFAGNDLIDGRGGFDRADYNNDLTTTSGITVNLAAGTVTGDATVGTDTLVSVEAVRGTNLADTYNAVGFSGTSTNAGSLGTFNEFTGQGGNDIIIGNGNTRLGFNNATAGVVVDIAAGTATGDSSVGSDTFTGVNAIMGSMFADSLSGSVGSETFTGLGGDDFIDGLGGFDTVSYNNIYLSTGGVSVNMAAGIATGDATIGTDTLRSIEGIQGTMLADTYDATGYGVVGALNVSSSNGNFNQFEGLGGDDQITGNGNTRVIYSNSADGVIITIGAGGSGSAHGTAAGDAANVGNDSFTGGVNSAIGGNFADSYNASSFTGFNSFQGNAGNDTITGNSSTQIQYGNATAGVVVDLAAGAADGDGSVGHDTFTGVNSVLGSNLNDTLLGSSGNDFLNGSGGNDMINGRGGNDNLTGGGGADTFVYQIGGGADFIVDFNHGQGDRIDVTGVAGVFSLADIQAHASQQGSNTVIDFGSGNTITLQNLTLANLMASDFVFNNSVTGTSGADVLVGTAQVDGIFGLAGNDRLQGLAGDDWLDGGLGFDRATYTDATGPVTVNLAAATATGAGVGTDTLVNIEAAAGSNFADTFDATGFTGVNGNPGGSAGSNAFEGMGGNDLIIGYINAQGQALTRVDYLSASDAVTVDIAAGTAHGTNAGDLANVGTDSFSHVATVFGSAFNDTLLGSNNAAFTYESYEGRGGDDFINGRGGYDTVTYNNDPTTTSGIIVHLADGIVTGDATVGTDTLQGVEAARGTNFDDVFDATGFGLAGATNVGSSGTFNDFGGMGGNDTIIGNGNTRLNYQVAAASVTVDLETSPIGTTTAITVAGSATGTTEGTDTFTGVNAVQGSTFADTLLGSSFNNTFTGLAGDDYIDGRGGFDTASFNSLGTATSGVSVNMAAGIATGDATIGTDTLRSIEGIQGTMLADTYDATGYGVVGALNVSSSNGNFNQFEGLGGDDQITGNGNTRVIYSNSADGVIITIGAGGSGSAHGTAAGDAANVGNDSFTGGVNSAIGGNFADSYNASSFTGFNSFQGNAGNDTITGNSSTQIQYGNVTSAVTITIGADGNGTATGDASVGTDSFTGVNSAVGSNFADSYNASGFTGFNSFQGLAGDDTITGNGSTQLGYYSATSGLTVDLQAGTAAGDASVGHDTFTGVNSVAGSNSGDTLYGNGGFNILYGGGGNDVLDGRGGGDFLSGGAGADTFVYAMGGGPAAISDFDRGNSGIFNQAEGDKIDLTGVPGIYNLGDIQAIASSPNGADTLIDFGNGDTLILTGVLPSDLVPSDFVFALGTSTTFETEVFPNPFGGSSSSLPGTLDGGTANVSVVGISTDGINFVPVTAGSGATVQGTYFNFAVNYSGSESLNVGVPAYQDANALIAAIEANENGAAPLSDTFYYQVQDQFGNDTIDKVTYTLSDLTFTGTGPLALAAIDGVPISLGSLQVHDWGVAAGFGSSPLSVTVTVGSGTLSLASAPVQYSTATFSGDGHSVTITGDEFQVDADLANLQFTGSAAGRTDITISGIDGPSHTATYLVGSIAVDDQAPSITGDLAIVTVKGSGVQLTGLATAVTTADLQAVDPDNTPDQLTFTVTGTSHGHLANSATGSAIASFTQAQLNSGSVFFVTDDSSYVGSGSFSVSLSDGVLGAATPAMRVGVTIVDAQFSVLTADGYNFDQDNSIGAMGSGNIVPDAQHSGTTFEIVNAGANRDFIVVGNGFAYDPGTHALTAGTITSILETTDDASHQPLASFGLYVPAVDWMNAVIAVANGDQSLIEALVSPWTFNFIGNAGADAFGAANLNDIFTGRAGTDTLDGQFGYDRANYGAATGPINVQLAAGIVTGDASTGTDTLKSIEMVTGSNDADTFDATGFGATSTNAGSTVTNNVAGTFNEFEGRGGVDLITGNGATRVSYYHATSGVTVTFDGNSWNPAFNPNGGASGTATGDASVGTDHFTGVTQVRGSFFGDTFTGSNNPFGTAENFEGLGGNDNINGGGGFDRAQYFQASDGVGITVQLANGIVTGGPDTGTDTLTSIEGIYGTDFADIYDATGFTGSGAATPSANSGNSGSGGTSSSFNEFEGGAGNDTVTGNGNTRVAYYHATGGVVVTLGSSGSGDSFGNSSVGHDHFNGSVNAVRGSEFNDIITGNGGNNTLEGLNGNDVLDGKGGNDTLTGGTGADIVVFKVGVVDSVNSPSNNDTITDFSHFDGDRIDLRAIPSIQSLSDVFSHATQVGSNTVIDFSYLNPTDPTSLTLLNVTMANLTASDFIFASSLGPSVSVTVQTPDGYDFSMLYDDLTASNPLQSANDSNHIFAVDAAKGITFELIGGGIYDTSTHQWTSGLISEIDILNTTDPTQTTQDHVLVNTNGWTISASDLFAAIGGYAGNGNASLLNGIFNSATYSIVGTAGFADNNSKSHDGADVFFGGDHADIFNGLAGPFGQFDPGNDTVDYSHAAAGVTADLFQSANNTGAAAGDIYISIENLRGTAFNDTLTGDGMNNVLEGGPGHNALNGGGGWNTASYEHAATGVTVDLAVTGTEQTVAAGMFDTLTNIQNVRGSSHDDTLTGNGSSMLEGGPGNDHLIGQPGQSDTASYEHATSGVTVNLAVAGQQDTQGAGLDTLTNIANLTGSQYNDTLTGDTHSNILFGNGGNDTFVFNENAGGIGQDTIGDFMSGQDHIQLDYAAFDPSNASSFSLWLANHVATANNGSDLLIDLNPDGSHPGQDTILLKNASFGGLHASDFILPNHP